jgi:hypothetical protein
MDLVVAEIRAGVYLLPVHSEPHAAGRNGLRTLATRTPCTQKRPIAAQIAAQSAISVVGATVNYFVLQIKNGGGGGSRKCGRCNKIGRLKSFTDYLPTLSSA